MTQWLLLEDVRAFGGLRLAGTVLDDTKVDVAQIIADGTQVRNITVDPLTPELQRIVDENAQRRLKGLSGLDLTSIFSAFAMFAINAAASAEPSLRTIIWRPGGATDGFFMADYEDVQVAIDDAQGNITVRVDDSLAESDLPSNPQGWDGWNGRLRFDSANPLRNAINEIGFENNSYLKNPGIISRLGVYKEHQDGLPAIMLTTDGVIRFDNSTTFWNELGTDQPMIELQTPNAQLLFLEAANMYTQHFPATRGFVRCNNPGGLFLYYAVSNQLGIPLFPTQFESTSVNDFILVAGDASVTLPPQTATPFAGFITRQKTDLLSQNAPSFGTTAERPAFPDLWEEFRDTTLGLPIYWNGVAWVNALGVPV